MDIQLDDWQKEVLAHRGDLLLCTGRQIGKTYIMALKACKRMIEKPKTQIIIISLTEDQAKLIINMILIELEKKYKKEIKKGKDKPTQNKVMLKNGSFALARPVGNTGDAIRGFTGDILIIDEASRMPELAFTSGEPTLLSTGGEVWMCSTPHGKIGYFWEQFNAAVNPENSEKENEMGWKVMHINGEKTLMERTISESWTEEKRAKVIHRLRKLKERWSQLRYGQEILALFLEELQRFFDDEWIERVCNQSRDPKKAGDRFLGVDIGRMYDPSAFEDVTRLNEKVYHCDSQTTQKTVTTETQRKIIEMDAAVNYTAIGIDAGSGALGVGVYDNLMQTHLKRKLKPMNNRSISLDRDGKKQQRLQKEDFYFNLRAMGDNGELKLLNDDAVKRSLRSIQFEITKEEDKSSKIRIFGNDSHITEGLIRACWLAKQKKLNIWVNSFKI